MRVFLIRDELKDLEGKAEYLAQSYRRRRENTTALWVVTAAAVVCIIFLLAFLARAQMASQPLQLRPALAMLCDLDITLTPHDTQTVSPEKVDVLLKFSPLSADLHQRNSSLQIGSSGRVTIDPVSPPTNPKISLLQQSGSLITLGFSTTYSPIVKRLGALSHLISQFKIPAGYPKEISKANQLSFSYTLQGAETLHTHASSGREWLHLFPFDSADVYIPIDVRQAALLSHIQLLKPSSDYFADVSIDGLPISLSESENADRYEFANSDPMIRTPMWSGHTINLHAKFERRPLQRWSLTLGVAILALVVGAIGGWFTLLPDKSWIGYVITTLGLSGLVIGVRATVLATYKDLPTLMTGRGTTVFEILYIVSIVLMVGAVILTRRLLKP